MCEDEDHSQDECRSMDPNDAETFSFRNGKGCN